MKSFAKLLSLLLLFLNISFYNAIAQPCGTIIDSEDDNRMRSFSNEYRSFDRSWTRPIIDVPVKFHIIRSSTGKGGVRSSILEAAIQNLNELYTEANLRFVQYDEPNYIDDDRFLQYTITEENDMAIPYEVSNVINVFCVPNMVYAGYAYLPSRVSPQRDRIVMHNEYLSNGSTFPHEMGHYFGLYHTHGNQKNVLTDELVARVLDLNGDGVRDCLETGDMCCDTPADPINRLPKICTDDCGIDRTVMMKDERGDYYEPMVDNIMSYNPNKQCRTVLTFEQLARVAVTAKEARSYLEFPDKVDAPMPCEQEVSGKVAFTMRNGNAMGVTLDGNLYRFNRSYRSGDEFTFEACNQSEIPLNLYILNMDVRKKVVKVFPYTWEEKRQPGIGADSCYVLGGYIKLDDNTGKEYACLLYTQKKLDLDMIVREMESSTGTFTQRLYKTLGEDLLPLNQVEYVEGNRISFRACLKTEEILPIMLEQERK